MDGPPTSEAPVERVTTLELFFDLVFVLTITQLTAVLVDDLSWTSLWHVTVMLGLIFWMYDGYVWLTNAVPARGERRQILLVGGMAGYLILSLAIPDAFAEQDGTGLVFGVTLLAITVLHAALYIRAGSAGSAAAMRELAPANLAAAAAVVVGGALGGDAQAGVWSGVFLFEWFFFRGEGGFEIGPAHFVERHGLLVIVAIGESVVALGAGAHGLDVDLGLVVLVSLGLALNAGLWWAYFGGGEDEEAERSLAAVDGRDRTRMAFVGFGYAHFVLLLGVILTAVGIQAAVAHPGDELTIAPALALAGGVALFLGGDVWFRRTLRLGRSSWRVAAAAAVLASIPAGLAVSASAALAVATGALVGALAVERAGTVAPLPGQAAGRVPGS